MTDPIRGELERKYYVFSDETSGAARTLRATVLAVLDLTEQKNPINGLSPKTVRVDKLRQAIADALGVDLEG